MRVIAGAARGTHLSAPRDQRVRPTTDRVRETLFNILAHHPARPLSGAMVVDAFAGTGALGIEALSRGMAQGVFLDTAAASLLLVRENLERTHLGERASVRRGDACRPSGDPPAPAASLLLLDPPYGQGLAAKALAALDQAQWLAPGCVVAAEMDARQPEALPLVGVASRQIGDTLLLWGQLPVPAAD